jgi:hypothetical protein
MRSDDQIGGKARITCEGTGVILVRLTDGYETVCHIGYVTPGAVQHFEFVVEGSQCSAELR